MKPTTKPRPPRNAFAMPAKPRSEEYGEPKGMKDADDRKTKKGMKW